MILKSIYQHLHKQGDKTHQKEVTIAYISSATYDLHDSYIQVVRSRKFCKRAFYSEF